MLRFINQIKEQGINSEIVQEIISAHERDHRRMRRLYRRYRVDFDGPKIFKRNPVNFDFMGAKGIWRLDDKVNNTLNNSFDSDIVDTKVGYMFGHPITYNVEDKQNTAWNDEVQNFLLRSNTEDQDAECGKMAAICGYGARLAYIDTDGKPRIENVEPWQAVFLGKDMTEPVYSVRYYRMDGIQYAEFYDDTNVYFFSTKSGKYAQDDMKQHMFDFNPMFGVPNNKELKGDAEKVLSLIDAYDRTLSDASNEIEQYRLAYLVLKGLGMDEETLKRLRKTGVLELMGDDEDIKYLTKDINDALIEHHLDRLEQNILRFAKSVNFGDQQFAGNISGVAMRFKLLALENKCVTMERKMTTALRYQFKILCSAWSKKGICSSEDYLKIKFQFTRNLPVNITEDAQATANLQGRVSERTRLSLLPFVTNVDQELEEMQKDKDEYAKNLPSLTDPVAGQTGGAPNGSAGN